MIPFVEWAAALHGAWALALVLTLAAAPAHAQVQASPSLADLERLRLGSVVTADQIADLPLSSDLSVLLETTQPEVISDRMDTGGLSAGDAARIGAHGSSWTQTAFRIGNVDITDPDGSGTPFVLPGLLAWDRVIVNSGPAPTRLNAPGLSIVLQPRRPSASWGGSAEGFIAPHALLSRTAVTSPPAIERLNSWNNASLLGSGPLVTERLGLVLAGTWTESSRFVRDDPVRVAGSVGSLLTHVEFTPSARDLVRTIGWIQRTSRPFVNRVAIAQPSATDTATAAHVQLQWNRLIGTASSEMFAGYTARRRTDDAQPAGATVIERLNDGPVPALLYPGSGTDRSWSVGARVVPAPFTASGRTHQLRAGGEIVRGSAQMTAGVDGMIGELVNGLPARVWRFDNSPIASRWVSTTAAAYVSDDIELTPALTIDVGMRFESTSGSAAGAANGVSWRNWFPRTSLRWKLMDFAGLSLVSGVGRYGYRLPLGMLAYGDPSAPVGSVYRWIGSSGARPPQSGDLGALIARVGPGTGGSAQLTSVDPALKRPYLDEFVVGFEGHPQKSTAVRLTAIARRESQLVGLVNVGVPLSSYSLVQIPDHGLVIDDPIDDYVMNVYNRLPASFGADRYLLTNPADDTMTFVGVELSVQTTHDRFFLLAGATAGRSNGFAANRGFQAIENDQATIGELFVNPNATTAAHGRLFTERGYTVKISGSYRFGRDIRLGVVARYEDGQMFARMVVVPGLNQGPEFVRAFCNGRTRFTYHGTLDARLQKGFTIGRHRLDAIVDAFNLLNLANEVEETSVSGPDSRRTSAVQPPRAVHVGVRLTF